MRLQHGSAITLTLLASSLQLVNAAVHGRAEYANEVSPEARPRYPSRPVKPPPPEPPVQAPQEPTPRADQQPPQPPKEKGSRGGSSKKTTPPPPRPPPPPPPSPPPPPPPPSSNQTQATTQADTPPKAEPKTQDASQNPEDGPQLNVDDPRFTNFKPPGDGDTRSACPGLNSLANHGFLPHDGKQINATDIVLACFNGLGMSPETCSIIALSGLVASNNNLDFVFDLDATDLDSWDIAHDCSFSRKDESEGDGVTFNKRNWDVALDEMNKCQRDGKISTKCFGSARAARIKDQKKINPNTKYDAKAAGHGAVEVARMILTLGNRDDGADLGFIKSVFEEEKLPAHLGWKPKPYVAGVLDVLDVAEESQKPDPETLGSTSDGDVSNRIDILTTLKSEKKNFLEEVKKLCIKSGFRRPSIYKSLQKLDEEVRERFGDDFETAIDANIDG